MKEKEKNASLGSRFAIKWDEEYNLLGSIITMSQLFLIDISEESGVYEES